MEHEVTHSCGHTERCTIFGAFAADSDRQVRQLSRRKCTACYKAAKAIRTAGDVAMLDGIELPALSGSEKQVRWAETIRVERLAVIRRANPTAMIGFVAVVEAKWWIDNRTADLRTLSPPA